MYSRVRDYEKQEQGPWRFLGMVSTMIDELGEGGFFPINLIFMNWLKSALSWMGFNWSRIRFTTFAFWARGQAFSFPRMNNMLPGMMESD